MSGQFRRPEFLTTTEGNSDDFEPTQRVRCPVHGFIHYSRKERKIIDHPLFRRLRRIRQLALTEYVYPGACHTRFEHSLGVMHVATLAFERLASNHGGEMEERFGQAQTHGFSKKTALAMARQAIRLAGLIHDIGHGPFSHAVESVIHRELGHESLSVEIATKDIVRKQDDASDDGINGLKTLLDTEFWDGCAKTIGDLIANQLPPQLGLLTDLISGELDADRTDYLIRDSLHCGVDYGRFDSPRLIESLEAVPDEFGELEIAINESGLHAFEALILARYQLSTQVLYHHVRRIYDKYLTKYHEALPKDFMDTPAKVLREDDFSMLVRIREDAEKGPAERSKWAKRINNRDHHRAIHGSRVFMNARQVRASRKAFEELQKHHPSLDLIQDIPEKSVRIHKVPSSAASQSDKEDAKAIDLKVLTKRGGQRGISEISPILDKVPHYFEIARIYADTSALSPTARTELEEEAERLWRQNGGY